jgi:hypothetical protein
MEGKTACRADRSTHLLCFNAWRSRYDLIATLSLSAVALSASALEIGKPFEQLDIDRALPNIEFAP